MDQYNNHQQGLAWPSLFWAMVAVALNTMSQPSGKTLGFPTRYSFLLRSSPFVRGAHVLYIIMRLGYLAIEKRTNAANVNVLAVLMAERFEGAGTADGLATARKNLGVVFVLFALGASLQAVKLFAVSGIPLIHACCALYLASFLLDLLLLLGAPKSSGNVPANEPLHLARRTADRALSTFSAITVIGNTLFVDGASLAITVGVIRLLHESAWPSRTIIAMSFACMPTRMLLGFVPCSIIFVTDYWDWIPFPNSTSAPPSVQRIVELSICVLHGISVFMSGPRMFHSVVLMFFPSVVAIAGIAICDAVSLDFLRADVSFGRRWCNDYFVFTFAGLHIVGALLWCWLEFDPLSTTKPSWVDYLG